MSLLSVFLFVHLSCVVVCASVLARSPPFFCGRRESGGRGRLLFLSSFYSSSRKHGNRRGYEIRKRAQTHAESKVDLELRAQRRPQLVERPQPLRDLLERLDVDVGDGCASRQWRAISIISHEVIKKSSAGIGRTESNEPILLNVFGREGRAEEGPGEDDDAAVLAEALGDEL